MKQPTQKIILGCAMAITLIGQAHAAAPTVNIKADQATATVVTGSAGVTGAGDLSGYTRSNFGVSLSKSVALVAAGSDTVVAANAANKKGMHTFGASSNGGSVRQCEEPSVATPTVMAALDVSITATGCN
jgi:hypothetical protein